MDRFRCRSSTSGAIKCGGRRRLWSRKKCGGEKCRCVTGSGQAWLPPGCCSPSARRPRRPHPRPHLPLPPPRLAVARRPSPQPARTARHSPARRCTAPAAAMAAWPRAARPTPRPVARQPAAASDDQQQHVAVRQQEEGLAAAGDGEARRRPRPGVGEHRQQGLSLQRQPLVRPDKVGRIHVRIGGEDGRLPRGAEQGLHVVAASRSS